MNKYSVFTVLAGIILFSCQKKIANTNEKDTYKYLTPEYTINLSVAGDTILFKYHKTLYYKIKSANIFIEQGIQYVSFFDDNSGIINIYNFRTAKLARSYSIKDFPVTTSFYNTVYIKNNDSILISTNSSLNLFDSARVLLKKLDFPSNTPGTLAFLSNRNPLIIKNEKIFAAVRPFDRVTSLKSLSKANAVCEFNTKTNRVSLKYNIPQLYTEHLYGFPFLRSSYCYNNNNQFVISFAADPKLYVTNLEGLTTSHYGKSLYQVEEIKSVNKKKIESDDGHENYLSNYAYGAIYFDHLNNRYLRVVKHKRLSTNLFTKSLEQKQSIIIFDSSMKIIGESLIDSKLNLDNLFICQNGDIYCQLNIPDREAFYFVKLMYN